MAAADRPDPGGGSRCRGFCKTLSAERAPGVEGQPPLRAAVELIESHQGSLMERSTARLRVSNHGFVLQIA